MLCWWNGLDQFQFPSNGKGFPNLIDNYPWAGNFEVKFQFPSNGKGFPNYLATDWVLRPSDFGFNSLQTGKAFRTRFWSTGPRLYQLRFNSLQTGKAFRTKGEGSVLQHTEERFQFPSNGKGFPNINGLAKFFLWLRFNSLQTGKAFRTDFPGKVSECPELKFQFPSNGKGFPNEMDVVKMFFRILVSIPFKRERLSEHSQFFHQRLLTRVSIPFKRERLSEQRRPLMVSLRPVKFQFPSNGKGFPNKISVL